MKYLFYRPNVLKERGYLRYIDSKTGKIGIFDIKTIKYLRREAMSDGLSSRLLNKYDYDGVQYIKFDGDDIIIMNRKLSCLNICDEVKLKDGIFKVSDKYYADILPYGITEDDGTNGVYYEICKAYAYLFDTETGFEIRVIDKYSADLCSYNLSTKEFQGDNLMHELTKEDMRKVFLGIWRTNV